LFGQRRQGCSSRHSIVVRLWNIGTIIKVLFFTEISFEFEKSWKKKAQQQLTEGNKSQKTGDTRVGNVMPIELVSL
jgi:hypothetical protein